ncbi:MAG: hypothetical protein ABTQ34_04770 [Bdellovibrionales bacterium]
MTERTQKTPCGQLGLALLGSLWLVSGLPLTMLAHAENHMPMQHAVIYAADSGEDGFPIELTVKPDGSAILKIQSVSRRSAAPPGIFASNVPTPLLARLAQQIESKNYRAEEATCQLVPGETYREIVVADSSGAKISTRCVGERTPASEAFVTAERVIQEIMQDVAKRPLATASLRIGDKPSSVAVGEPASYELIIENSGSEPVKLVLASAGQGKECGELSALSLEDVKKSLASMSHQPLSCDLRRLKDPRISADGHAVTIGPKQSITLPFAQAVDWSPGHYKISASLTADLLIENFPSRLSVKLTSPETEMQVTAKP